MEGGVNMEHPISLLQSAPRGTALLSAALAYADAYGYPARMENGHLTVGDPIHAPFLIVVTGDLSGTVTALEILRSMPYARRACVAFLLYPKCVFPPHLHDHGNLVLHLKNVACGNELVFAVTGQLWQDIQRRNTIAFCVGRYGKKTIAVRKKPISAVARQFRSGVCVSGGAKGKKMLADRTNINLLRAAIVSLIAGDK